jgi:hypothetical protein
MTLAIRTSRRLAVVEEGGAVIRLLRGGAVFDL